MAYPQKRYAVASIGAGTVLASTSTATAAQSYVFGTQMKVNRIMATVTTAIVCPTSAGVYTFFRRPTQGSDAGIVTIGTLTLPTGTAVGKTLFKDVSPVVMAPGEELVIKCSTASVGAGNAGAAIFSMEMEEDPEDYRDQTNMVASA